MAEPSALFIDGSVNPQRRIGIGAVLRMPLPALEIAARRIEAGQIARATQCHRFEDTSSTQLEIQTALRALEEHGPFSEPPVLFTDSQCVAGLLRRRERLESADYLSVRTGRPVNHAGLYRRFFELWDEIGFSVRKVSGHSDYRYQDAVHRVFHYVDREARRRLKQWLRQLG